MYIYNETCVCIYIYIYTYFVSWPRWWTSFQSWWRSEWRPPDNVRISEKYLTTENAWASSWWGQKRLADLYSLIPISSIQESVYSARDVAGKSRILMAQLFFSWHCRICRENPLIRLSDFRSDFRPLIEACTGHVLRTWTRGPVDSLASPKAFSSTHWALTKGGPNN